MKNLRSLLKRMPARPRRVVFTCLFGYSEPFADEHYEKDGQTDFICFTDDRTLKSDMWTFRYVDTSLLGPVRTSRMIKILAHRSVGDYETSIWLDNTIRMVVPYGEIFDRLQRSASPLIIFRHPGWSCVYKEADVVKSVNYDDPAIIDAQMAHYRKLGHPEKAGLVATGYQARRHTDPALIALMEQWFMQVCRYSYRDQLSFNVVARWLGFEPEYFAGTQNDKQTILWPTIPSEKRLPRDFSDDAYLDLHEDVRRSGINPREHYLKVGMPEGRPYKLA